MKEFKDKEERKLGKWKTVFMVLQDMDGNVFVDNRTDYIKDEIARKASVDDALYMLRTALVEFEIDRMKQITREEMGKLLDTAIKERA